MKLICGLAGAAALGCANLAAAQETPPAAAEPSAASEASVEQTVAPSGDAAPAAPAGELIRAGAIVDIELAEPVSSNTHKKGDKFAIRLAYPLSTEAGIVIPAGTPGGGEVVSAAPAGMMGKGGELLLAARYLEFAGQKIPLRSFKLGASGKDYTGALVATALLAPLPVAVLSLAVKGGELRFPIGAPANAKIATDVTLPVVAPLPAAAEPATAAPTLAPKPSSSTN